MHGFDVNRFVREKAPRWQELDATLDALDAAGVSSLDLEGARRLAKLYRGVSSDLIQARTELVHASVVDYLNGLLARAYAHVHVRPSGGGRRVRRFLLAGYPRLVRAEWRPIALAAALFFAGAAFGAVATVVDPRSHAVVVPEQHQGRSPAERVRDEEQAGGLSSEGAAAPFSSFLFTHNIQVTFMAFALGITFAVGTVAMLFYNGVPLGALAAQYHLDGEGLFFWAWILPHGIPELTSIFIAGGAGLILGRGLLLPGRRRRGEALRSEARIAVRLVVGTMPLLVLAGLIEGTLSQMHEPFLPYPAKLVFAAIVGACVYAYLLVAGRDEVSPRGDPDEAEPR